MNCVRGAVDGGSRWSFTPKSSKSHGNSRRDVEPKFPKTSPLSSTVETVPIAGNEVRPEPEFPGHLEGSSSASSPGLLAGNKALSSGLDLTTARRALQKRSRETFPDAEPSGSGHQTQDAVLKDLLASTSLSQRAVQGNTPDSAELAIKRSTTLRRRNQRIAAYAVDTTALAW